MELTEIDERLHCQEKAIEKITDRLTQLAIYEGEVLNASKRLQGKISKLEELEQRINRIEERLYAHRLIINDYKDYIQRLWEYTFHDSIFTDPKLIIKGLEPKD